MAHIEEAQQIYRSVTVAINNSRTTLGRANDLWQQHEDLKTELFEDGFDWVEDFEELDSLEDFWSDPDEEDIDHLLTRIREQLEGVLERLGVDPAGVIKGKDSGDSENKVGMTNITFSPNMVQNMSASFDVNVSVEISHLLNDFERELDLESPDKSKLVRIKDTLVQLGAPAVVPIVDMLIKRL